jgi:aryl-alcohol dehydrogenase-like predicted oxidoreductase
MQANPLEIASPCILIKHTLERDIKAAIIPCCMTHDIGFAPFSPIASGLLSGRITPQAKFESYDDVRNWVPQLSRANIKGSQPIVDLLKQYADMKDATPAQISLAWMLHKYPNVVPIPGSMNKVYLLQI